MSQMTLGELIAALKAVEPTKTVVFDFPATAPTTIASSRGWYDHPALGWAATGYSGGHQDPTVAQLLAELTGAIGRTYEGWKGGDYRYHDDSPLWVDNPGDWSRTCIRELDTEGYAVVLVTERRDV